MASLPDITARGGQARRRRVGRLGVLTLAVPILFAASLVAPASAAASGPYIAISNDDGFDGCQGHYQPTPSDMQAFWTGSSFYEYFLYIGGSYAYCPNGISQSWFSSVLGQGWGIVGLWVGPQCCGTESSTVISDNTTNAYNQGVAEADKAANQWCSWGQCYGLPEPIAYDFEHDTNPTAEHAFLRGWTHELQGRLFSAGAYASTCSTSNEVGSWASLSPTINFAYPANYNGQDQVYGMTCLSNSPWSQDQRFHQYQGGHSKTLNNVTLNIDSDCANGPVLSTVFSTYGDSESSEGTGGSSEENVCVNHF